MKNLRRKLSVAASAVALSGAVVMTGASGAEAAAWGCAYPYVCTYDYNGNMIEDYKAVTSGFQTISSTNVYHAVNSRNDDVAYIRHTNGLIACLPAGHPERVYKLYSYVPNGIRIDSSASCGSTLVPEYFVP